MWLFVLLACLTSCSASRKAGEEREPFVIEKAEDKPPAGLQLAMPAPAVRSAQLYRSNAADGEPTLASEEVQFPVMSLGSTDRLTLKFDLMEPAGRPLSVYFYHANATWERDLTPSEFLGGFHQDHLLAYTPSRATDIPYVHYTYRFPNESISFLLSGNYILRVTEQGREEDVLFERPFYVSEQGVPLQLGVENSIPSDRGFGAIQPSAAFVPTPALEPNTYDFQVCFVRNGRFEAPRCTGQPRLFQIPSLHFYLEPNQAFEPITSDYFLDLSALRIGPQIARIAFDETPVRVVLEPDFARFPGNPLAPLLQGQSVVAGAVVDVAQPDLSAQYATVVFSFVTDTGGPVAGGISIVGSFTGWDRRLAVPMAWNEAEERYEGEVVLKQGQYEYRYVTGDESLPRGTVPRPENLYTAFLYFADVRLQTDRLLAIGGMRAP